MNIEEKQNVVIAVIGKSAAGKSAFIKTFTDNPELINSEGGGQTTRTYIEYKFHVSKEPKKAIVRAQLMTKGEFTERRVEQVLERFVSKQYNVKKQGIDALASKFNESKIYKQEVRQIILHSKDFFDIEEFYFLGVDREEVQNNYNIFIECIERYVDIENGSQDNLYYRTLQNILSSNRFENDGKDDYILSELLKILFEHIYDILIEGIKKHEYLEKYLLNDGNSYFIKFPIIDETKNTLAMLLTVVSGGEQKKSLSGLLKALKIESNICKEYYEDLYKLGLEEIELIDTFGLDHSSPEEKDILIERYNRIFGKDYPNINIVFFVEAFHAGASTEFSQAINLLYSQRPDIMTYIVGTYIDDNPINNSNAEWLCSDEKQSEGRPNFNGNVMEILYGVEIITTLMRSQVSESMATMRCGVMQKRFAPFCGNLDKVFGENEKQLFSKMNRISIQSLFSSIVNEEHLGDKYVDINIILQEIESIDWENILKIFIHNITSRFSEIITRTYSRTRGKLRKNLKNYILGFDGSTIDATWYRVFRDAYIQTFSKQITVGNDNKYSISKALGYEGNSRVAVDELINKFMYNVYGRSCNNKRVGWYSHELNCSRCFKRNRIEENCIWGLMIEVVGKDKFSNDYTPVGDWLRELHNIEENCTGEFYDKLRELFIERFKRDFVRLCRYHNAKLIRRELNKEGGKIKDIPQKVQMYIQKYDTECRDNEIIELIGKML